MVAFVTIRYLSSLCDDFKGEVVKAALERVAALEDKMRDLQLKDLEKATADAARDDTVQAVMDESDILRAQNRNLQTVLEGYGAEIAQIGPLKEANKRLEDAEAQCESKLVAAVDHDKGKASDIDTCHAQVDQLKKELENAKVDLPKLNADVERFKKAAEIAKQDGAIADSVMAKNADAAEAKHAVAGSPELTPTGDRRIEGTPGK